MREEQLTKRQIAEIEKVTKEWLAEAEALKNIPESKYEANKLNNKNDTPTKLLTKKYVQKIREIKQGSVSDGKS